MRLLAIGDIHGCFGALRALERGVPFRDDDLVVTLGDLVDRGPNSAAVVDWAMRRHAQGRLVPLLGNHEVMMCKARYDPASLKSWLRYGGDETLLSYCGDLSDVPDEHWEFLERTCRRYYETDTHFFVHANVHHNLPLADQPDFMLFWEQFRDTPPHASGKTMVCGHTAQKDGVPRSIGHAVCIDTRAHDRGWLTCLEPATGDYWQASEDGRWREGKLGHPP